MYTRPAALSVLHRFCFLLVLSNVHDPILSKSSLPNVQGVLYLSPWAPQPTVLCSCLCPSLKLFACSRLKLASPVSIGFHPLLRIVDSLARDYMNRLALWYRHHGNIVCGFLNLFKHMYTVLKHCYLFHHLSVPCPTLLHVQMQRNFFLKYDFKAWMLKLSRNIFYSHINCLQTIAFNCFHLTWWCKRDSPCMMAWRFWQGRRKPSFRCFPSRPCLNFHVKPPLTSHVSVGHVPVGGGSPHAISWASLSASAKSTPEAFDMRSTLCYAAHVLTILKIILQSNMSMRQYLWSQWWIYSPCPTSEL